MIWSWISTITTFPRYYLTLILAQKKKCICGIEELFFVRSKFEWFLNFFAEIRGHWNISIQITNISWWFTYKIRMTIQRLIFNKWRRIKRNTNYFPNQMFLHKLRSMYFNFVVIFELCLMSIIKREWCRESTIGKKQIIVVPHQLSEKFP